MAATSSASVGNRKSDSACLPGPQSKLLVILASLVIPRMHSMAEMVPGSCVHASSWAIDSSVDPENFHLDDLQQCVSQSHHLNHSFPVSILEQQHSLLGSAVSPILEGSSVCCQTKAGGLSLSQKGSWFALIHFLRCNTA